MTAMHLLNLGKLALILSLPFVFLISGAGTAHAQQESLSTVARTQNLIPKDISGLTTQNGWNCDINPASVGPGRSATCSNTSTDSASPLFGSKVYCTGDISGELGGVNQTCKITFRDNSFNELSADDGLVRGDNLSQSFDEKASSTGSTYTPATAGDNSCGITSLLSFSGVGTCIVKVVGSAILALANFILGIAGTLLNWVVLKTVFQFGSTIGNSPGVLIAWGIFRDIGNLILLFGFIFMGIATILNTNTFSAKKALPSLLIFAILMNFSLFAAEAIIDGTNAITSVMYAQANSDSCLGGSSEGTVQAQGSGSQTDNGGSGSLSDCAINYGLAGHIMQSTGLSTMWQTSGSFSAEFFTYVGLALFATIGAVVMIAASIMLVIRLVILTFVMVAAPIGFAGFAIPPMRGFAKQWWDKLISQAIFAPVLFLLILVSLKITDSFSGSYGERGLAGALTQPNASVMGIVMIFVIVIGFLIASLVAARSIGAQGASFAINTAGKVTGKAVFGTTGFVGRRTVGRGSAAVARQVRSSRIGETELGRRLAGIADKGAKSSFDVRGTKAFKNASKAGKLDFGEAQKGGIKKEIDDAKKMRTEYAKSLKGRTETQEEYKKRLDALGADSEKKKSATQEARTASEKAAQETDQRLQAHNQAQSELDNSKASRPALELQLERLQRQADRDPNNADLQQQIRAQKKSIDEAKERERAAEQKLAEETTRLAEARGRESAARDTEAKAIEAESKAIENETKARNEGPGKVDAKRQQGNYADNLERSMFTDPLRPLFGATGRANEEAAKAIRDEMKKSKQEKLLEEVKKKLDSGDKDGAKGDLAEATDKKEGEENK